jgi:hypothetical protein
MSRRQFSDAAKDCIGGQRRPELEYLVHHRWVDLGGHTPIAQNGFYLRGEEHEIAGCLGIEKRAHAHPIPGKEELPFPHIPNCDGELAVQLL